MKREIKFRAFENANCRNRMFDWREIKKDFELWLNCEHTSVMQYTGLKDKNGREIYEGDIIRRHRNVYWVVEFIESKWQAHPRLKDTGLYLDASQFIITKVIGNIHEHPELITKP